MKNQNRKIPKIRFNNSKIDWQQVKFKNLLNLEEGIRRGPFGSALKKEFFVQNSEYVVYEQQNAIYDHFNTRYRISEEKYHELNKFMLSSGDFIMSGAGTIGKISLVPDGIEKGVFNQALIRLRVNKNINKEFFLQWMRSPEMQNKLTKANPASAMVNLVPMSEVKEWDVIVPSFEEQSAIGSLFRTLDDLLFSYKDNLANYQSLKATMLSKMFPKAGQTVPEIRLDEFEGEWENSKISDYVNLLNGRAFKQDELLNEGKYRVVRVGNFNTNEKWYYSNLELEEDKYANKDDLLYLWATNFGPEIWKEEKIIFHYHIWKFEFDRSIIDRNYLYYWLEKDKKRIQQNTNGSTMVHVTKSMMENREFLFPMFREQQAIGTYFSNLDNLINSHQEKITQLETLKKKLLQDMFI